MVLHRNELRSHGNKETTIAEKHDTAKSHESPQPKRQALKETIQNPAAELQPKKEASEVFFINHYIVKQLKALIDIEMALCLVRDGSQLQSKIGRRYATVFFHF